VSAALFILALLPVLRFALAVAVALVALVTKDADRRATAVTILPMVRSVRACVPAAAARVDRREGANRR
jgi:hypothetical protein